MSQAFRASLPFTLTGEQQRVLAEISADLAARHPMQRLLQGDVGSGKTIVAALAAAQAIDSGFQVALMAPTEILAEQHFRSIAAWMAPLGVSVSLADRQHEEKGKDGSACSGRIGRRTTGDRHACADSGMRCSLPNWDW